MDRAHRIAIIGGDGIGPEVTAAALTVLDAAEARFGFRTAREDLPWSSQRYLDTGERVTAAMIAPLREQFDAILLGAIGHPEAPRGLIERDIILGLRLGLDLYVNLRPIALYDERLCPLKDRVPTDIDILVIRENTEDVYVNTGTITGIGPDQRASVEMSFTRRGIERVVRYAFDRARERRRSLTLVDKANAIPIQGLWRDILEEIGADYPDVSRDAIYVDAACMWLVQHPERFDTIVTTNLFGDIITDLGAALVGGLGVSASGNLRPGETSVFEPIHGSAPKYAGKGVASPVAAIGAVALMLDHLGERDAAKAVERAVRDGFTSGRIRGADTTSGGTTEVARTVADVVAG